MLNSVFVKDFLAQLLIGLWLASKSEAIYENACQLIWILKWKFFINPWPWDTIPRNFMGCFTGSSSREMTVHLLWIGQ